MKRFSRIISEHDHARNVNLVLLLSAAFFTVLAVIGIFATSIFAGLLTCLVLISLYLLYEFVLRHAGLIVSVVRVRFSHHRMMHGANGLHERSELSLSESAQFAAIVSRLQAGES